MTYFFHIFHVFLHNSFIFLHISIIFALYFFKFLHIPEAKGEELEIFLNPVHGGRGGAIQKFQIYPWVKIFGEASVKT